MAANQNKASFTKVTQNIVQTLTVADTGLTGDNALLIATGGANDGGSLVSGIFVTPLATNTLTRVNIYISEPAGVNKTFFGFALIAAATIDATSVVAITSITFPDGTVISDDNFLRLKTAWQLWAGLSNAQAGGIGVIAIASDF